MLRARLQSVRPVLGWVVAVWALTALAVLVYAFVESNRAAEELHGVRDRAAPLGVLGEQDALRAASRRFDLADRLLSNPVLAPLRVLPVASRQLEAVETAAEAGAVLTALTADTVDDVATLARGASPRGVERLAVLRSVRAELAALREAVASVELGDGDGLLGPARTGHRWAAEHVAAFDRALADAIRGTRTVEHLLEGPTSYLVLLANNAEMRVGSGMFLAAGLLELRDGRLRLGPVEPATDLVLDEPVPVPPAIDELWGWAHPGRDLRSLGLSPRFPVSAAIASQIWQRAGRPPVDGVLVADVVAIRELLEVIGPVEAGDRLVSADDVVPYLLREQYASVRTERDTTRRREQLAEVARAAVARIGEHRVDVDRLAAAVRRTAEGRHLMVWSPDARAQRLWRDLALAGMMSEQSLLIGLANADGSKLDQFLETMAELTAEPDGDDRVAIVVRVTMTNRTPPGAAPYVIGPDGSADYDGVLVAYLPVRATAVEADGGEVVVSGRDGPSTVAGVNVDLDPEQTVVVTFRFRLPEQDAARVVLEPGARLPPLRWEVASRPLDGRAHRRRVEVSVPFG